MWFKNLQFYRLGESLTLDVETLENSLGESAFRHCGPVELFSQGWVPPLGRHGTQLLHSVGGYHMLCLRREEKVLPGSVINEQLQERVADLEQEQGRSIGRKEKADLKESIINELLPGALAASKRVYAYLAPQDGFVVVNAASVKMAEELLSALRKSLGSFPVRIPRVRQSPADRMTAWLEQTAPLPAGFALGADCELRDPQEGGGVVRCSGLELSGQEISSHLQAGKKAVKVALEWEEHLDFVLAEDLSVKRLRFSDALLEEADDSGADDPVSRFDTSFALMSLELKALLPRILDMFDGEADRDRSE